ncbi:MAG: REP-associated tyrosine transposase [Terriglobales bacterium]
MPYGLKRYQQSKQSHFVTFSCYRRLPHLQEARLRDLFVECLERTRRSYRFRVYGYVVMPEHIHLLVSEPNVEELAKAIQALKISVARRAMRHRPGGDAPLWQKRYYDHNVRTQQSFVEKLRYLHRNPVKRGLVERPEDWKWSSFRHYALAETGSVEIESQWTADRRTGRIPRLLQIPGH